MSKCCAANGFKGLTANVLVVFLLALLAVVVCPARAQEFGGTPPSIKWKQVKTPAARIIFSAGMDSTARSLAYIIDSLSATVKTTIGTKQRRVSIVLQNQTTESNGYVGLAPFRSEFFLTPQQNSFELGSIPWPQLLAVHEYRHVQQYSNFNTGLSRALSILFGEGGQAFGNALSVPNWFFEGDAVYNETLVTKQGRGRLPYFFKEYRALWAAGKQYSWMKLRNGSLVDMVPNHYPLGYMLVAYGREKYGDDFWRKVTHDAAAFKYGPFPMQKAIKKYAGVSFKTFHQQALGFFEEQFADSTVVISKHFVADEQYPVLVNDSTLIYLKSTYNKPPQFVVKTPAGERKIATRGLSQNRYFDYNTGQIIYAGYRPNVRWGNVNYHEIRVLNVKTGIDKAITSKTKYFSPAFNADGSQIVAVNVATNGNATLHILDSKGKLLYIIANKGNLFYTYPKFLNDGSVVVAVRNSKGQMAIAKISVPDGAVSVLLPYSYHPVGYLRVVDSDIYFTATQGADEQLFKLSLTSGSLSRLKQNEGLHNIGSYQPTASANKIAWVGYTINGFRLTQQNKQKTTWVPVSSSTLTGEMPILNVSGLTTDAATDLVDQLNIDTGKYKPVRYSKSHNLFNFHSIIPEISDPDYTISILGENVLNTLQSEVFFDYNRDEGYKQVGFNATYGALFPYITSGIDYVFDRRRFYGGSHIYWNELNLHGGLRLPLNFSSGKHITGLVVGTEMYYTNTDYTGNYTRFNRNFTYLNSTLQLTNHIQQGRKNIYPRWGQSLSLIFKSAISAPAQQFLASGTLYLPGIAANHSLLIGAAYQGHGLNNAISFSNNFPFSRGYTAENLYRLKKVSASYHFPIAYPDAGIANAVYLLRLRGNVFYDHTEAEHFYVNGSKFNGQFRSVGGALYFDTRFFNEHSLTFGLRYNYLLDKDIFGGTGHNRFEIVMPVSLF